MSTSDETIRPAQSATESAEPGAALSAAAAAGAAPATHAAESTTLAAPKTAIPTRTTSSVRSAAAVSDIAAGTSSTPYAAVTSGAAESAGSAAPKTVIPTRATSSADPASAATSATPSAAAHAAGSPAPESAAIRDFPRRKARTLRFTSGAPRSAQVVGDGSRALFLRSDGPEDLVTSLWMNVIDPNGDAREILLADPRQLLADADSEDVPAEERARRERAREGGAGIVAYSVDAAGGRVTFTINGQLFLTEILRDGAPLESYAAAGSPATVSSVSLAGAAADAGEHGTAGSADIVAAGGASAVADTAVVASAVAEREDVADADAVDSIAAPAADETEPTDRDFAAETVRWSARTRRLAADDLADDTADDLDETADSDFDRSAGPDRAAEPHDSELTPVLNPRISPDGRHVAYTTGEHLILVDIAEQWPGTQSDGEADSAAAVRVPSASAEPIADVTPANVVPSPAHAPRHAHRCGADEAVASAHDPTADRTTTLWSVYPNDEGGENTWRIGLAEFVAGEEMDRYDGFWWSPDSDALIFETFDASPEPVWYISDPANPQQPASARRYARALTRNADVRLTLAELTFDEHGRYAGLGMQQIAWDRKAYEYVAAVRWSRGHDPLLLVQNRRQTRDQVLRVVTARPGSAAVGGASSARPRPVGSTVVLAEHANDQWLDLIAGTPAYTPDGRLVCALNDMAADTNRLTVDGRPFTPSGWQVREVLDVTDSDVLAVVQRTPELDGLTDGLDMWDAVAEHDARSFDVVSFDFDGNPTPVTVRPGVWTASRAGDGLVISGRDMTAAGVTMTHSFTLGAGAGCADGVGAAERAGDDPRAAAGAAVAGAVDGADLPHDGGVAVAGAAGGSPAGSPATGAAAGDGSVDGIGAPAVDAAAGSASETAAADVIAVASAAVAGDGQAATGSRTVGYAAGDDGCADVAGGDGSAGVAGARSVGVPDDADAAAPALTVVATPIANHAAEPGFTPNVTFTRLGERRLYTAIVAPSESSPYAHADRLPVLLKPYGGPGHQQVVFSQSYYWDAQWWADQGFLVVIADGRGTTGRGLAWDREIFEHMKDVTLADQVDAVRALPDAVAQLNTARGCEVSCSCAVGAAGAADADGAVGADGRAADGAAGADSSRSRWRELAAEPAEGGCDASSAQSRSQEPLTAPAEGGCAAGGDAGHAGVGADAASAGDADSSRSRWRELPAEPAEGGHAVGLATRLAPIPAPDLDKVCMIGWSYGGFLSALAVLDAPDVVKAACAGAPPTDWTLYDTHYTERYLGLDPAVYERNSIIADAPKLTRPLMLIHGFADDNVTIAHSLRLSQALMAAGRPHTFLPLTGITHMTNDETVAENLLILQRDFLRDALDL